MIIAILKSGKTNLIASTLLMDASTYSSFKLRENAIHSIKYYSLSSATFKTK